MAPRTRFAAAFALLISTHPAFAGEYDGISADVIVQSLVDRGYPQVVVSRTWLGRTRIFATGPAGTREIVLNPNNGEVLRDASTVEQTLPETDSGADSLQGDDSHDGEGGHDHGDD